MNRVVIVTGGASPGGISQSVVRRLVASGDTVAMVDIDLAGAERTATQLEGMAGAATAFGCDVGDRSAVFETVQRVERQLGAPWGLVNCPAWSAPGPAEDIDEESVRRGLDGTLNGAPSCSQAVFPHMKAHGGGRIVNFGSEVSDRPTDGVSVTYLAAKGAIRSLTRGLAWEWGRH